MSRYGYSAARDDDSGGGSDDDEPDGPSGGVGLGIGFGGGSDDDSGGSSDPAPAPDPAPPPAPDPDPSPSPGGSSPPPSDTGGPSESEPDPDPSPAPSTGPGRGPTPDDGSSGGSSSEPSGPGAGVDLGGVAGDSKPSDAPGAGTTDAAQFGPGPTTKGGLGEPDPGGDSGVADDVAEEILGAEANEEIVDRATTGGLLSERGESAGLFPSEISANTPQGTATADISETRLRETAEQSARFGSRLDLGAAFSSPADPTGGENRPIVDTSAESDGLIAPLAPDPENENPAEEFVEGGARVATDLPGAAAETETLAEAGQSLLVDDLVEDFGFGEVAETGTAAGRDKAARTAAAAAENPAGFAGALTASAFVGAGALSRGRTGTFRDAVKAEVDPRIGPFGTTMETKAFRRFLGDDRGQAQLIPESRDRDGGTGTGTGTDDDLGPDVGVFDRSDRRLFDPARQFDDDVGGMADQGPTVDPADASSRQDIGAGVSGQGDPGFAPGVDADSFSSRGFGDVSGTELDPNPTSTFTDDLSPAGAGVGGLFGAPESESTPTGAGAGGLLGTPGDTDATGATPELGADTFGGVDLNIGFDTDGEIDTDPGIDVFGRTDTGTDPGLDQPSDTDLFDTPGFDQPTDQPTDTPTFDQPTDQPTDTPTDIPTDIPTDTPTDRDIPFFGDEESDEERALFGTTSSAATIDSGIQSGAEAAEDLFGGGDSDENLFSL